MANHILQNPIIAAVIEDLNDTLVDVDAVQRLLDSVRAQIAANSAIYADEAAQLAEARRRLAEALFAAASRLARTEPEEQQPSALPEPEPKPGEEEMEELVAALAAPDFAEVAARLAQVVLQEEGEVVVQFEVADSEVGARAAEYLQIAVRVECSRQNGRILVQARSFLLLVRAAAFAITRAHLLPGVLLTVAVAYALAYAASGGTVVPGSASLLRISGLVLCFLFGVPVVGNLA